MSNSAKAYTMQDLSSILSRMLRGFHYDVSSVIDGSSAHLKFLPYYVMEIWEDLSNLDIDMKVTMDEEMKKLKLVLFITHKKEYTTLILTPRQICSTYRVERRPSGRWKRRHECLNHYFNVEMLSMEIKREKTLDGKNVPRLIITYKVWEKDEQNQQTQEVTKA